MGTCCSFSLFFCIMALMVDGRLGSCPKGLGLGSMACMVVGKRAKLGLRYSIVLGLGYGVRGHRGKHDRGADSLKIGSWNRGPFRISL